MACGIVFPRLSQAQSLPDSVEIYSVNQIDSSLTPISTSIYQYDQQGNILEESIKSQGILSEKFEYQYTMQNVLLSRTELWMDDPSASFLPVKKEVHLINSMGMDTGTMHYSYSKNSQKWELDFGRLLSYAIDANGRYTEAVHWSLSASTQMYTPINKTEYSYLDADNLPDAYLSFEFNNGNWVMVETGSQLEWANGFTPNPFLQRPSKVYTQESDTV